MLKLKSLRESKGWTQTDLYRESGVSQSTISDIETGKRNPTLSVIKKLASALEVSPLTLLGDTEAA